MPRLLPNIVKNNIDYFMYMYNFFNKIFSYWLGMIDEIKHKANNKTIKFPFLSLEDKICVLWYYER